MTARMIFPPGDWNKTVNIFDTIVLDYTSTYPGVNLTLWCETVKGTNDWIWWDLPGPLPSNGTYNLHLADFDFTDSVNVWPTQCHFDLVNSKNNTQVVNGGNIPISTRNNVAGTTWSLPSTATTGSATTSAASTLAKPTAHSSGTSQSTTATTRQSSGPTNTAAADTSSSGFSSSARVGVGVGVGLGVALFITLAVIAVLIYRRRRQRASAQAVAAAASTSNRNDNAKYETAELLGNPVPAWNELSGAASDGSHSQKDAFGAQAYPDPNRPILWGPPQEMSGTASVYPSQNDQSRPPQRYELGA